MVEQRRRYVVGARRIRDPEKRDAARAVLGPVGAPNRDAGYEDVIGSNEDGPEGEPVAYVVHLTPEEVARFTEASNARYVEEDPIETADPVEVIPAVDHSVDDGIPGPETMAWLGADLPSHDGDGTLCAVLDGGTTQAVRERMGWELVAKHNFTTDPEGPDGITNTHGCLVTPNCLPPHARLIEAIIGSNDGWSRSSWFAQAARWACDRGAQVINYSYSGSSPSSVSADALAYARDRGVLVFASAGNDGQHALGYPAANSRDYANTASSIAFDERNDLRAPFSNYHETATGCAPGVRVVSLNAAGELVRWSGTSASSPLMAMVALMALTGGRHTPMRVMEAFKATARDTPAPKAEEGGGGWNLRAALAYLEPKPEPPPAPLEPLFYTTRCGWTYHRLPPHWWMKPHRFYPTEVEAAANGRRLCLLCKRSWPTAWAGQG